VCDVYERGVPKNEDGERLKMPKVSDEIGEMDDVTEDHHRVRYSDLDANGHCNSGRYFEILLDAIEPGEAFTPSRFEITYVKEAMLGQVLKVKWTQDALGYRFHVTTLSGETCCRAAIENADS
jgi:acyl-ACP thioesterase